MVRQIIKIDESKCNGCGLCADACHEGAIAMVDGVAKLIRDDYCDGLGDCLPSCPTGAISFEERVALPFDKEAVLANMAAKEAAGASCSTCPGSASKPLDRPDEAAPAASSTALPSQLRQWPVQIKLAPIRAPYFDNAKLLIAADCTAYAYGNFHNDFIKGHVTLIGCPKLDEGDYTDKLTAILQNNNIKSIKLVRMEVPCCGGIQNALIRAMQNSGKMIPWQVVTISSDGRILD